MECSILKRSTCFCTFTFFYFQLFCSLAREFWSLLWLWFLKRFVAESRCAHIQIIRRIHSNNAICNLRIHRLEIYIIVKLREREGQRVDLGRSLKGHLWMVDGGGWDTFPWCFTLNLVATHHHHHHPPTASLLISRIKPSMDQVR